MNRTGKKVQYLQTLFPFLTKMHRSLSFVPQGQDA